MFIAVDPNKYISILYQGRHSIHPIKVDTMMNILNKYKYANARCVVIDNEKQFDVGFWFGVFSAYGWKTDLVKTDEWMDYFGLYPDDKIERVNHWLSVAKLRYPMMSINKKNYEVILTACYLHDKYKAEQDAVFA
tara:strand:- start:812 stop:1216 length:405 start_codon:yes stop_codon:yes gene_type:complete